MATLELTGFSSFPGCPANPTEILINEADIWLQGEAMHALKRGHKAIYKVSAAEVRERNATMTSGRIRIHLGVDCNATHIKLEQHAYNNATFRYDTLHMNIYRYGKSFLFNCRVPDMDGYQPLDMQINDTHALNHTLQTSLPLSLISMQVSARLNANHCPSKIDISPDAGRYLCNYIYYLSLSAADSPCLFIHIPPFDVMERKDIEVALNEVINYIVYYCSISDTLLECGFVSKDIMNGLSISPIYATCEDVINTICQLQVNNNILGVKRGEEYKLVLCVNNDLHMTKGKLAAQCCHACLGVYRAGSHDEKYAEVFNIWERCGETKVVLKVESDTDLISLQDKAASMNVLHHLVADAGRTQIPSGSLTVLAVGPAPVSIINAITGHLKLL